MRLLENHDMLVPAINAELGYAGKGVSFYEIIENETIALTKLIEAELAKDN